MDMLKEEHTWLQIMSQVQKWAKRIVTNKFKGGGVCFRNLFWLLRALVVVELKNYIAILAPPKHKKNSYSNGAKPIFFNFIVTVHIYLWMCIVT